jgi:hypothetical protein
MRREPPVSPATTRARPRSLHVDVRQAHGGLLNAEMVLGGLADRADTDEERDYFRERQEQITKIRRELDAISHAIMQRKFDAYLWAGLR